MKKWFRKNKNLLLAFSIFSFFTLVVSLYAIHLLIMNADEVQVYATTGILTTNVRVTALVGVLTLGLILIFALWLVVIMLKILMPDKKAVADTFYVSEWQCLLNLSEEIRKELSK